MKNLELARILYQIAEILELQEVQFKPRAYQKAALTVENLSEDIEIIYKNKGLKGLEELPGIGESIAEKIAEFLKTGKIRYYQQLKKQTPFDLEGLGKVPGLGPKTIKLLYVKLKIKNLKDLEKAAQAGKIRKIKGLGEKEEQNILEGIQFVKKRTSRMVLGRALPIAEEIKQALSKVTGVKRVEIAGSYRRGKETVGDLDILAISSQPKKVTAVFTSLPDVAKVVAKGITRSAVRLKNGLDIDLRVLKEKEFGSAFLYFTGSKQHNIALRKVALKKGYTLNEYGLFKLKPKRFVAGKAEEEVYRKLSLQYIPPELRENTGELEAAAKNRLPKLITLKDARGDFQMHSKWSDGSNTIREMAEQSVKNKLKVIALTDHVGHLGITHSLKGKRFADYLKEIDKLNKTSRITILKGAEVDIDKEGKLVASKQMLKELDLVLASVHSSFRMPEKEQTKRICLALENHPVNIYAHPTGREINNREPMKINMEKLFETAKRTDTFLEINGSPQRMDLKDAHVRAAKQVGCKFSFGSDAHSTQALDYLKFSVVNARRGWLEKKDILNCWTVEKIKKVLKSK